VGPTTIDQKFLTNPHHTQTNKTPQNSKPLPTETRKKTNTNNKTTQKPHVLKRLVFLITGSNIFNKFRDVGLLL